MSSPTAAVVVSLVGLKLFTPFMDLPPEIRLIIWRMTLSSRIVEVLTSFKFTGFHTQAALPVALHVCRESRQMVEALYPHCIGSILQPERVRFNFDLDILFIEMSREEDCLHHFFGILKEFELSRLKYFAVDEDYLHPEEPRAALKRALEAMTNLKELIVVCNITPDNTHITLQPPQVRFYPDQKAGEGESYWPMDVIELPDFENDYRGWGWIPPKTVKMTAVFGWRRI